MCLVVNFVVSCVWSLCQLDANNAFLQDHIFEDVYMVQAYFYFYFEKKNIVVLLFWFPKVVFYSQKRKIILKTIWLFCACKKSSQIKGFLMIKY